jgi:N5-(cytidine 5'-diphosphoramidyl)-L-glutamine hydrolase
MSRRKRIRVGITQRLDAIQDRDEQRDGLDSNWAGILWNLGMVAIPLNNFNPEPIEYLESLGLDAYLLSGGNNVHDVPQRNILETAILETAAKKFLPVFGVCRGFQFINYYQGGSLVQVEGHVAIRHNITGALAGKRKSLQVNSFHHWAVPTQTLGRDLTPLAFAPDGTVEAFKHDTLPWLAIMWHPEREYPVSKDDLELMQAHLLRSQNQNGKE